MTHYINISAREIRVHELMATVAATMEGKVTAARVAAGRYTAPGNTNTLIH